jgi:formate dehydrogenase iron-sulfur subunit
MSVSRRGFIKTIGVASAGACACGGAQPALASHEPAQNADDLMGVLVDIPRCIGCRRCEYACRDAASFNPPPEETFRDRAPLQAPRRPSPRSHTVINQYVNSRSDGPREIYNKFNCLHCIRPACMSVCPVSAFSKSPTGAVIYDAQRCMGCRYCMIACPFEIPTYDYDDPLTPEVRKCNLCAHIVPDQQQVPACIKICPAEVMTYGRRADLVRIAHERIASQPDQYVNHVYGEHEAGGTLWMWISKMPFEQVGFRHFGDAPPPALTEGIQHSVFKKWVPPVVWYGILGAMMFLTRPDKDEAEKKPPTGRDFAI